MHALLLLLGGAWAADPAVPAREIPPSVLVELQLLENRFELALASDCPPDVCYSKGCVWLDHAVADQPRARSMPGLSEEPGPSPVDAQAYLTLAQCSFAHEPSLDAAHSQAIVRRLQTRLTHGWTVVTVDQQALSPLGEAAPEDTDTPVEEPVAAPVTPPAPEEWTAASAAHELWDQLLPDVWWMVGIGLFTAAATTLIWSWRRVGRVSAEEEALLREMAGPEPVDVTTDGPAADSVTPAVDPFVAAQEARWKATLSAVDPAHPDPELQALVRERLRAGDLPFLAKAVLRFPAQFPALFPSDGETATAKLELAALLQTVDVAALPDDTAFFTALQRHALAATLTTQPDARIVRSLREDFGAAGLAELIGRLSPRLGALLFAWTPPLEQHETVRLLSVAQVAELASQLLRSNRMDPSETQALFEALRGARPTDIPAEISDRGATFDAPAALAVLLPWLPAASRVAVFEDALQRTHGVLPAWTRGILTADMVLHLPTEARADLLLEIELEPLAAWLSLQDADTRARLSDGLPDALRRALQSAEAPPSRERQLSLAGRARRDLARGLQRQLARLQVPFESVVVPGEDTQP